MPCPASIVAGAVPVLVFLDRRAETAEECLDRRESESMPVLESSQAYMRVVSVH
jgi:hypothetical protein